MQDTVPALIVRARDFIADATRLGEAPTTEGAYAQIAYKYPMIAVREIIANAIVHRDYEQQESSVQIQMYSDRARRGRRGMTGPERSREAESQQMRDRGLREHTRGARRRAAPVVEGLRTVLDR
jgi:hypothetical protein